MPRSVIEPTVKQLTDHYLRQPFRGARIQRGYGIGGIFKVLPESLSPYSNEALKLWVKRH